MKDDQDIHASLNQAEANHKLSHTPVQFSEWIEHVNQLLNLIVELSYLLGLAVEERKELFAMAGHYAIVSLDRQTMHRQSQQKDYGGRPRDKDNDWAFEQVYKLHRPHCEVYQEWLARRKEHGKLIQIADPYDSFKKALNTRRKKGKKGD